jgi:hypothetical protein
MANSLQSSVENKINRKDLGVKTSKRARRAAVGSNPFFTGMRGDRLAEEEKYLLDYIMQQGTENVEDTFGMGDSRFCLPCDLKDEVHSKPPSYKHVHSLRYDPKNRPKKLHHGDSCQCVEDCGEDCFNRMVMVECFGEGKETNCNVGPDRCRNRSLGKKQYAKCKPKREDGKGWGLIVVDGIKKGQLVQEYVGEVIDEKTKEQRLSEWVKEHPNDPNFYIMALPSGWYIDARLVANLSRFINHSCDPNCVVHPINVKGFMRDGISSIRDISPGEFLSYDYHFDTKDGDKFVCRCGAKKCRGTMKGGGGEVDEKKPLGWKDARAQFEADKKYLEDVRDTQVISKVDALVPAAEKPTDLCSAGPQDRYRDTAVRNRIFLWRNATRGANFTNRAATLNAPTVGLTSTP